MSESTTIVKGKKISLTALVFIDRECRLIFRFLAVVCFEVEVERIFLSEKMMRKDWLEQYYFGNIVPRKFT